MKNVTKILTAAILCAALFASTQRTTALGGASLWPGDEANIGNFPAQVNNEYTGGFYLENFKEFFFQLCQKLSKIEQKSSLGPKEAHKNSFYSFPGKFRPKLNLGKKVFKIAQNDQKTGYF